MLLHLLKSKLHLATVTAAKLHYHGSVSIPSDLLEAVGLLPYERILISNCANGLRGETYVIPGEPGAGQIQMNGAMARLACEGDRIIIMSFAELTPEEAAEHRPKVAVLDRENRIVEQWEG